MNALLAFVDRLIGAGHEAGDRAGDHDAALAAGAHLAADAMDEIDRSADIGADHVVDCREILVEKALAEAASGIGEEQINRPLGEGIAEPVDAFDGGKVRLDRVSLDANRAEIGRGLMDRRFVGGNDKVEAVPGALHPKFIADAGGSAGDDGQRTQQVCHVQIPDGSLRPKAPRRGVAMIRHRPL